MTNEGKNPTEMLNSIKEQREKARSEPSRLAFDQGKPSVRKSTTSHDIQRVPFTGHLNDPKSKFKTVKFGTTISEVELNALLHISHITKMSKRATLEAMIRKFANDIDPLLVPEIEAALTNV